MGDRLGGRCDLRCNDAARTIRTGTDCDCLIVYAGDNVGGDKVYALDELRRPRVGGVSTTLSGSVGLLDAAAVTSATVGGCREVKSGVRVVSAVVVTSAVPTKPLKALSSGSACPLGHPRVVTPLGESLQTPMFHTHPQKDGLPLG